MNPASWLPPAAGGEFTQPSLHLLFLVFMCFWRFIILFLHLRLGDVVIALDGEEYEVFSASM